MDKKTLELILNAVLDAAEKLLAGKMWALYAVKAAREILLPLLSKLAKEVKLPASVVASLAPPKAKRKR